MMKTKMDKIARALGGLLLLFALTVGLFTLAALCGGCVYKGAKVTEGTDLALGLTVPGSEGALQLDVLNYLTGFRLGVAENAALKVKYTVSETNSYLGVVTTCTSKTIDAKVEPCEVAPVTEDRGPRD